MNLIQNLTMGFAISLSLSNIVSCLLGVTLGTIIGVLPGIGPTATIALLLPLTYKMDVISAIIMLSGIYYGAQYGGTITSVLVNIPGEASSVVTCIDGYQMARKGRAGVALGIAAFGSFIAGTFGTVMLSLLAPPLSTLALVFGPPEYALLLLAGLSLVIYLSGKSILKAMISGVLGLALGTIGFDSITAIERFTFGSQSLMEGIDIAILAMGIFGIGEVLYLAKMEKERSSPEILKASTKLRNLLPNKKDWKDSGWPITRGTIIGFFLGVMPGGGAIIASFATYGLERRISKHSEKFGTGAIEGVAAPESANNSASSGAFIPLLTLGIPCNAVMALLLGAFMIHGINPGPLILKQNPQIFWGVITSMYIGNVLLMILNVPLIGVFVQILRTPYTLLSPMIVLFCVVGAFSINNNPMDILIMVIFGVVGYLMRKFEFDAPPLMLAFVLGPLLERALRRSLIISHGSLSIFFQHPVTAVLMSICILIFLSPLLQYIFRKKYLSKIREIHIETEKED
jgi:putative tricarboxylic transport membrane protein